MDKLVGNLNLDKYSVF